jgi:hypothetical protein
MIARRSKQTILPQYTGTLKNSASKEKKTADQILLFIVTGKCFIRLKGIVSPDWKGLQMVSLDRFEV